MASYDGCNEKKIMREQVLSSHCYKKPQETRSTKVKPWACMEEISHKVNLICNMPIMITVQFCDHWKEQTLSYHHLIVKHSSVDHAPS